jgi:DNA-binding transcriptional MocR family regulator
MRYRIIFAAGLAVGFVLGARAGRERYEQLRRLARKAADSPAVQQAAAAAQAQAGHLARSAREQVTDRMPRMADSARSRFGEKLHDRMPGSRAAGPAGPGGTASADGQPYVGSPDSPQS